MFFLVFLTLFVVGDLVWLWWSDRQLRRLPRARGWRIASACFTIGMLGALFWWLLVRLMDLGIETSFLVTGSVLLWHLLVLPVALVLLMVWGGGWGAAQIVRRIRSRDSADAVQPADTVIGPADQTIGQTSASGVSRRQFLGVTAAAIPPMFTIGGMGYSVYQLTDFRVRKLTVPIAGLPAALEGMTIAHVSDTHVGRFTQGRVLRKIVEATNTLDGGQPCDLVLLSGDLINDSNDDLPAAIEMVQRMRARSGVFLVEGNHDLFDDPQVFDRSLRNAGLNLLLNEAPVVEVRNHPVQVMGLVWGPPVRQPGRRYFGGDASLAASLDHTLRLRDAEALPILLAHHPHALDYASDAGIPLTLSGHTHGGQFMLTRDIGPGPIMYRYWSGLYRTPTGAAGVISNGVGNWFPLRINAPAEILHLTLTAADAV